MPIEHMLHDGDAVITRHTQVQHQHIGQMLLIERDGLGAITCLGNHFHIGLLIDDRSETIANHRMVVRQNHADLAHQAACLGRRTRTLVPRPGSLSSSHWPLIAWARSRMLLSPNPCST